MEIFALLIGILFVVVGVAGVAYSVVRGFGGSHQRGLIVGYCAILPASAGLLLLNNNAELAFGLGMLVGAIGLCGLAIVFFVEREPPPRAEAQPEAAPKPPSRNWTPASERVAAGMRTPKYAGYRRVAA